MYILQLVIMGHSGASTASNACLIHCKHSLSLYPSHDQDWTGYKLFKMPTKCLQNDSLLLPKSNSIIPCYYTTTHPLFLYMCTNLHFLLQNSIIEITHKYPSSIQEESTFIQHNYLSDLKGQDIRDLPSFSDCFVQRERREETVTMKSNQVV